MVKASFTAEKELYNQTLDNWQYFFKFINSLTNPDVVHMLSEKLAGMASGIWNLINTIIPVRLFHGRYPVSVEHIVFWGLGMTLNILQ